MKIGIVRQSFLFKLIILSASYSNKTMLSSPISETLFLLLLFRDVQHVTVARPLSIPNATSKLVSVNVKKE